MTPPQAPQSWTTQDGASHPTVRRCVELLHERFPPDDAARLERYATELFRRAAWRYLEEHGADDLLGLIVAVERLLEGKQAHEIRVRAFNPTFATDGWDCPHTVLLTTISDRPFLYDSIREYLVAQGTRIVAGLHPILGVERRNGHAEVLRTGDTSHHESVLIFELSRVDEAACAALAAGAEAVLAAVVLATEDYGKMSARVNRLVERVRAEATAFPELADALTEAATFFEWMVDKNFVFLGYREYDLVGHGDQRALAVHRGSGLGILRHESASSAYTPRLLTSLDPDLRERITGGDILVVAKTNRDGVVHRRTRMDYVGLKKLDGAGTVIGECRFLGLFTAKALGSHASEIPILRQKLQALLDRTGLPPGAHDYKLLAEVFEGLPKDDLFEASVDDLQQTIDTIAGADTTSTVRCVVRENPRTHGVAVMVIMPRDRFNAAVRQRVQELLAQRLAGEVTDYRLVLGAAATARLHFYLRPPAPDARLQDVPRAQLEAELRAATESWEDRLLAQLREAFPAAEAEALFGRWGMAFPEGYQERTSAPEAVADIRQMRAACETGELQVELIAPMHVSVKVPTRLKLYSPGLAVVLSDILPVLEALGLYVLEEVPTEVRWNEDQICYIHDFGLVDAVTRDPLDVRALAERLPAAILAVLRGHGQNDRLNALVLCGGMTWREVELLRTYLRYYRQLGTAFTARYVSDVLVRHGPISRRLLEYFAAKFSPAIATSGAQRLVEDLPPLREEIVAAIDGVESLDEDRILRVMLNLIDSTVRTNYFQDAGSRPHIAVKVRSQDVLQMPLPRPMFEIFVQNAQMEGIHLRGGMVARGGIRWSDRLEDYRTEVLGLMKTQMIKNAVIVPVGSKGGFIIRHPSGDRATLGEQVVAQYSTLIRGMLDITDTIADGAVVRPADVVAYDGDDPYLVVAADKGTAHLSDTANGIAEAYGFWLGDAFASGGSKGYDHKKEGITARGAWECAKRHFRELGKNIQVEPFTVAGIGDMGGDVFGNGMLRSKAITLVAAFNHQHIFLDPDPDPERSFQERARLFALPRSSWRDYDPALIASGGGVFDRRAKHIEISPQIRTLLKLDADRLSGPELVRAILRAPVEMLYNGGIGTYIKHSEESNLDVGDKANDSVRIDGRDVRAQVIVEGGNLGATQRGRVEAALHGVRLNTDAIDNSGGVDMSDHEVNLKILLTQAMQAGELEPGRRDALLVEMTDMVADAVLRDNYLQSLVISQDAVYSRKRLDEYRGLLTFLCEADLLDRETEFLPTDDELAARAANGGGLTRPELGVLVGYAKNWLAEVVRHSHMVDDPHLHRYVEEYFPPPVARAFPNAIAQHRLRRDILATQVVNVVVNQAGTTFVHRVCGQTDAEPGEVIWAYLVANEMFRFEELRAELYALDDSVPADAQYQALRDVEAVLADMAKWLLQNVPPLTPISVVLTRFRARLESVLDTMLELHAALEGADMDNARTEYRRLGLSDAVTEQFVLLPALRPVLDVLLISETTDVNVADVALIYMRAGHALRVRWLLEQSRDLPAATAWERMALNSARDDLQLHHRRIVYAILRSRRAQEAPLTAMKRYWDANGRAINRYLSLVGQLAPPADLNLAALNVLNRSLKMI